MHVRMFTTPSMSMFCILKLSWVHHQVCPVCCLLTRAHGSVGICSLWSKCCIQWMGIRKDACVWVCVCVCVDLVFQVPAQDSRASSGAEEEVFWIRGWWNRGCYRWKTGTVQSVLAYFVCVQWVKPHMVYVCMCACIMTYRLLHSVCIELVLVSCS